MIQREKSDGKNIAGYIVGIYIPVSSAAEMSLYPSYHVLRLSHIIFISGMIAYDVYPDHGMLPVLTELFGRNFAEIGKQRFYTFAFLFQQIF